MHFAFLGRNSAFGKRNSAFSGENQFFWKKNEKSKTKNIKVVSIAKRNKELFIEGRKKPILLKTLPQEIYNLILQLDDEAHRFAINYHKKLRKNSLLA